MNIGNWLMRAAQRHGEAPALFLGRVPVESYRSFAQQAQAVAGWLINSGIQPGARVALFMENVPRYLIVQWGVWLAGAAVVPINAKLHAKEAAWIIEDAGASCVFVTRDRYWALREAGVSCTVVDAEGEAFEPILETPPLPEPVPRAAEDLAWLFYTSGTTGQPKGVMITHRMLIGLSLAYLSDVDEVRMGDAALYAAPMSHGAGIYNMMHVLKGARHVFPASRGFDPGEIFKLSAALGDVHMFAAPTMVKRMTDHARAMGGEISGLRTVVYAGGPMYLADIIDAHACFGDVFVQIYGQGECPMAITVLPRGDVSDRSHPNWQARLASVGFAQSNCELRIADPEGAPLPPGETGEILVRGDVVMPGYWNNPEASAKALRGGWLWTGDMGHMDEAGYVTLVDRSKDMIISGGSNIYPREVEEVLLAHPSVEEVSVVGHPHSDWGEEVVAFIVSPGGFDAAELDAHCLSEIARFKRPKRYIALNALPKNNYGKVLKTELRTRL